MKKIMCIFVLVIAISGCEDMKMDKNVEKQITLSLLENIIPFGADSDCSRT